MKVKNERIALLVDALSNLKEQEVYALVDEFLAGEMTPLSIQKFLSVGLQLVAEYYQSGEYFLADLLYASYIYNKVLSKIELNQIEPNVQEKGIIVIGTVAGDIHEMAKSIVANTLSLNGFRVIDLGTDLESSVFVDAVKLYQPDILALSCLLKPSLLQIQQIHQNLIQAGLRDSVQIIAGGNPSLSIAYSEYGADAFGADAISGLEVCLNIMGAKL